MRLNFLPPLWKKILALAAFGIIFIVSIVPTIFNENIVNEATNVAKNTAQQYLMLRSYYTKNVISKLKTRDRLSAAGDHKHNKNAIPLPATMIHELSELSESAGLKVKLYSVFPFPQRTTRVLDSFEQQAWQALNLKPNTPYISVQEQDDRQVVRFAMADRLTEQGCVDCHNSHPQTPKTGWKIGDVRGVLEVTVDIDQQIASQQSGIYRSVIIFIIIFSLIFYCLYRILSRETKNKTDALLTPLNNQKIAMNAHSLVSMADKQGNITYVNKKFSSISGYSEAELIGKKHSLLNSNNQPKSYWHEMHKTVLAGNIWHDEVRNRAKDGHYYWVDTTIVPNYNIHRKIVGFTSIRTDITQKKEDARLLSFAKDRAELDTKRLLTAKDRADLDAKDLLIAKEQAESAKFALDQHSLVSIADVKGKILYVNKKFIEISGYQESELIGKKHSILNSQNKPKDYWKNMHQEVAAGNVWHDEVRNRSKDGSYYWVDTTIVPNYDYDNKVVGFTSIRTDITEQKKNLENLAIAKKQAEVASHSKADFLANMSHEIRTPMNGVIGMTNLLLNSELDTGQHKLANTVKSSAVGLLSIINDILDFSKVDAGKLDLELIPFNLGQLMEDIGSTLSFQSKRKNLEFVCPANPVIQQWVKADPGRLRQILTNLIGNAIKFTEQGEVAVYVRILEQTKEQTVVCFEIKDTGIGINDLQQQSLFEQFSQADNSTTRKFGGTGLGLSISKKLVELMDGEIGIDSILGQGATFWFTLPLLRAEAIADADADADAADFTTEKVLIVEGNETNRELLHQYHKIWDIPHTLVASAEAALAELKSASGENAPYNITIIDQHFPEVNALQLCQQIHKTPTLAQTKIILASAQTQRDDSSAMKATGVQAYLTKPIQRSELLKTLLSVSGLSKTKPDLVNRQSCQEQVQFNAHILAVEDNPTNQLVIEGLLKILGVTSDLVANGEEAITALQGISHYDLVFMDCQMPVLDGYQATKRIRSEQTGISNSAIPIIAMTANAMTGDKKKCLDAGMDDYLSKPVDPEKVIHMLEKWLPNKTVVDVESTTLAGEAVNTHDDTDNQIVIFDYEDMSKRMMNDPELIRTVTDIFCQDQVEQLNALKVCLQDNDNTKATAIMHQIKGASANVGGKALSALALKMELAGKAGHIIEIQENLEQLEQAFNTLKNSMEQALI